MTVHDVGSREMFAPPLVVTEEVPDGLVLRSPVALEQYDENVGALLRRWGTTHPDRLFLAERDAGGEWRRVNYGEALGRSWALGQALLERGLGDERPLMILSGNGIDHALLALAAQMVGVRVVPVSVAYSLMSKAFSKLRAIERLVEPGMVFATPGEPFAPALQSLDGHAEVVTRLDDLPSGDAPGPLAWEAAEAVGLDSVAKVLFTSGSTGEPKGVINTHRMLCANQQMVAQTWPFLIDSPPVLVDWLPWNHTFGGNHNFNLILRFGGSMYIDEGRPAPALIEKTVRNVTEISPTMYFNVPAGYGALLPFLEKDGELASKFFERLELIFYAGAALPQDLWERLEALSRATVGRVVPMTTAWGSTETAPLATSAHFPLERAGNIGVPVPGVEIKMVPNGAKHELRVRGPNVTPGYLRRPDLTEAAFDDDGFYRIGDAGRLTDPADPSKGLIFDGRIAEDFKLTSGTWVPCGKVRVEAVAAMSPIVQDAVVAGADRDYVALLVWLNVAAAETGAPDVVDAIRHGLEAYNAEQSGSSTRIGRALVMVEPPSIDAGEITDKGYVNQRATLDRRVELVERLFADPPPDDAIVIA